VEAAIVEVFDDGVVVVVVPAALAFVAPSATRQTVPRRQRSSLWRITVLFAASQAL
jgi:hypothetical protein